MSKVKVLGPVELPWQHLIYAIERHAENADAATLAEYDADRLLQAARVIQQRIAERRAAQSEKGR